MHSDKKSDAEQRAKHGKTSSTQQSPEWADGLRQLYDSVVEEPIPDSFKDLLSKLDKKP